MQLIARVASESADRCGGDEEAVMRTLQRHTEPRWVWLPDEGAYGWHDGHKMSKLRARWTGETWVYGGAPPVRAPAATLVGIAGFVALGLAALAYWFAVLSSLRGLGRDYTCGFDGGGGHVGEEIAPLWGPWLFMVFVVCSAALWVYVWRPEGYQDKRVQVPVWAGALAAGFNSPLLAACGVMVDCAL